MLLVLRSLVVFSASMSAEAPLQVTNASDAAGCPEASWFAAELRTLSRNAPSRIAVRFEPADTGLRAVITLPGDTTEERSIHEATSDCARLGRAVLLSLRVRLSTLSTRKPLTVESVAERVAAVPSLWGYAVNVGGGVSIARTPSVAALVATGVSARHGLWGAELEIEWATPADLGRDVPQRLTSTLVSASLGPCVEWRRFGVCLPASVGVLASVTNVTNRATPWAAGGVRLWAQHVFMPAFALRLVVDLMIPVVRTRILLDDRAVWESPLVALGVSLRAQVGRFP